MLDSKITKKIKLSYKYCLFYFSILSLTKSFNFENKQLMNLVIVESPAKAKTINKYLGKEYLVLRSYSHIRDLPSKMDP